MKFIRGTFFLLFFLIAGFVITAWISSLSVPKGSGLAGPGIVVGYGLFGSIAGLIVGIILLKKSNRKALIIVAVVGFLTTVVIGFFLGLRTRKHPLPKQPQTTIPVKPVSYFQSERPMGLGMAYPKLSSKKPIYFYNPNLKKLVDEHTPYDSLTLVDKEAGPDISYAPPWFYPEIMKLDYNLLVLRVTSLTKEWIQVEVNKQTGRTAWLSVYDVDYIPWEKFILGMNSVEPLEPQNNPLRARPFTHGSPVKTKGSLLIPIEIRDEWLKVDIVTDDYRSIGTGWVRWKKGTTLLISYSLLS